MKMESSLQISVKKRQKMLDGGENTCAARVIARMSP